MSKRRLWLSLFGGAFVMLGLLWMVTGGGRAKVTAPQLPPPSTTTQLSAADLAFGRQQVDQMMRDRSQMAVCVERGDVVYLWAVRQFAGEAAGQRIYWHPNVTDSPDWALSTSYPPTSTGTAKGRIFIREKYAEGPHLGQNLSCGRLWACAVFEIYNISYVTEGDAIYQAALSGKISKQDFITGLTKLEYGAMHKTTQFYQITWLPFMNKKSQDTMESYWFVNSPDTYKKWIGQYRSDEEYPYGYYNALYDQNVMPYLKR